MIYARQVAPEQQESPFGKDGETYTDVTFYGNNDFIGRMTDAFRCVKDYIDCQSEVEMTGTMFGAYETVTQLFNAYFPRTDKKGYAPRQVAKWKDIIKRYDTCSTSDEKDIFCEALEMIEGQPYDYDCIRGCSQSEWQYIYYPAKKYDQDGVKEIEKAYFNLGTEWIVDESGEKPEEPTDIYGCSHYSFADDYDEIKKEIAEYYGVPVEEVVLYKHTGYTRHSVYEVA